MGILLIDADLSWGKRHSFPNLALMKISNYYKKMGAPVHLMRSTNDITAWYWRWTKFMSKVFTDTPSVQLIIDKEGIRTGGTGFQDNTPLPYDIEHTMPDYELYRGYYENHKISSSARSNFFNTSLGYLTRGCPRKCGFCVNKDSEGAVKASPLDEFFDPDRKYITLLDDNFLAYKGHKELLEELIATDKPFTFKQGLDIRLLNEQDADTLFNRAKYRGDYIFAFDDISEYSVVEEKLKMIRNITDSKQIKFYLLTGYKSTDEQDIAELFERIELLKSYNCLPYVMRYMGAEFTPYLNSENKGIYIALARWCNQPFLFRKMTFRQFCEKDNKLSNNKNGVCSSLKALRDFERRHPAIAKRYFN